MSISDVHTLSSIAHDCERNSDLSRDRFESDGQYVRRVITTLGAEADNHGDPFPEPDYYTE